MNKLVSIILLNYNGKRFLGNCLNSILNQSYTDFEIIFYDNASNDNSVEFVCQNFKNNCLKIIEGKENLGFAGGNNEALKYCTGELIVLLNNDTVVEKNWLEELVTAYGENENVGIVQSLVLTEGIPSKYYELNGTINLLGHNTMRVFPINDNGIGKILLATGAAMMFSKKLIEELRELFPNEYFFYAEDTYFSLRAVFAGYKNFHTSKSIVHHIGGGSIGKKKNSFVTFCQERNRLLNFLLLFSGKFIWKYIPVLIFNFFLKLIRGIVDKSYSIPGLFRAYYWILSNLSWIKTKREFLQTGKKRDEDEILKLISGKIFNGENSFERFVNFFSLLYCRITSIKVLEYYK
jgi:GT2 family glycosyltransferase